MTQQADATSNGGGSANSKASPRESGEDSEDESEILEESPCGRWLKRREEVSGGDNWDSIISWWSIESVLFATPYYIAD